MTIEELTQESITVFENLREGTGKIHEYYSQNKTVNDAIILEQTMDKETFVHPISCSFETRQIILTRGHINYLWAICYFSIVLNEKFEERRNSLSDTNGDFAFDTPELLRAAYIFTWAIDCINKKCFTDIPSTLPNPDMTPISDEEKTFLKKTNTLFKISLSFLMYHEFSHLTLQHDDIYELYKERYTRQLSPEETLTIRRAEYEADNEALNILLCVDDDEQTHYNFSLACLVAFISSLFYDAPQIKDISKLYHPDSDDRLLLLLNRIDVNPADKVFMYQMLGNACYIYFLTNQIPFTKKVFESPEEYMNEIFAIFDSAK